MAGSYDAVVVGSGPNGLAAAIALARNGRPVLVLEAADTIGGGTRSKELTLPGSSTTSARPSTRWRWRPRSSANCRWPSTGWSGSTRRCRWPTRSTTARPRSWPGRSRDGGRALGPDARAYRKLMGPLVADGRRPVPRPGRPVPVPPAPDRGRAVRAGAALRSGSGLAERWFRDRAGAGLIAGLAAHGHAAARTAARAAAVALMLGVAGHAVGWPLPRGGSQRIADALASDPPLARRRDRDRPARGLAGRAAAVAGRAARRDAAAGARHRRRPAAGGLSPTARAVSLRAGRLQDGLGPGRADPVAGRGVSPGRDGPPRRHAATRSPRPSGRRGRGEHPDRPFVLFAQPSLFDPSRAPAGKHTAWGYCHVPHGSTEDMTDRIEAQVERFAPGFRDLILARHMMNPAAMERVQPELRRRRHQRRRAGPRGSSSRRPVLELEPVRDARTGPLHLLVVDAARRRRARPVRLLRGAGGRSTRPVKRSGG